MLESKTVTFVRGVSGSEYISKISNDEYLIPHKEISNVSITFDGMTMVVPEGDIDSQISEEEQIPMSSGIRRITYNKKRITVFKTNGTSSEDLSITYTYETTGVYGFGELREHVDVYSVEDVYNKTETYSVEDVYNKTEIQNAFVSKASIVVLTGTITVSGAYDIGVAHIELPPDTDVSKITILSCRQTAPNTYNLWHEQGTLMPPRSVADSGYNYPCCEIFVSEKPSSSDKVLRVTVANNYNAANNPIKYRIAYMVV